jgi:hypothetical protein
MEKKKINLRKTIIIILLMILVIGIWAYVELREKGAALIDNPSTQNISVQIDNQTYQVPAGQFVKADVEVGKHRLTCRETGLENEELTISPCKQGIINPTKSKYVIYCIIYAEKDISSQFKPYQVEGREIYSLMGAPEVTNALFIPDMTMGNGGNIDIKEPSKKSYNKLSLDYAFLVKIFRLQDFFEFYDKNNK